MSINALKDTEIYLLHDYRRCIEFAIARFRRTRKITYSKLALASRIQTTYFTNVLKGKAHFSNDQLFAICENLNLPVEERGFVLLLLEWERAEHPVRKAELKEQLDEIRSAKLGDSKSVSKFGISSEGIHPTDFETELSKTVIQILLRISEIEKKTGMISNHSPSKSSSEPSK